MEYTNNETKSQNLHDRSMIARCGTTSCHVDARTGVLIVDK